MFLCRLCDSDLIPHILSKKAVMAGSQLLLRVPDSSVNLSSDSNRRTCEHMSMGEEHQVCFCSGDWVVGPSMLTQSQASELSGSPVEWPA